jgi:hypothetical protein
MKIHIEANAATDGAALFFVSVTQIRLTHYPGEYRNEANPATIMAETLHGLPAPRVHRRARRSR